MKGDQTMSLEKVREYLKRWNRDQDIIELTESTATVTLAAAALGVPEARIAKSLTLKRKGAPGVLVVASGDVRLDNRKFKTRFEAAPKMMNPEEALAFTGFAVGGISPFALPPEAEVYLDESLRRFKTVFPACGSANSMIELTIDELVEYSRCRGWVEVCQLRTI